MASFIYVVGGGILYHIRMTFFTDNAFVYHYIIIMSNTYGEYAPAIILKMTG